jgi:hypothetical protein
MVEQLIYIIGPLVNYTDRASKRVIGPLANYTVYI